MTDVLTVMTGPQDRWARRVIDAGDATTVYVDAGDSPIRVEVRQASHRFPMAWLRRHERRPRWRPAP